MQGDHSGGGIIRNVEGDPRTRGIGIGGGERGLVAVTRTGAKIKVER